MKVKITLDENETIEQADELLEKALVMKKDCSHGERYSDEYLNEFHEHVCKRHAELVNSLIEEVQQEIKQSVNAKRLT